MVSHLFPRQVATNWNRQYTPRLDKPPSQPKVGHQLHRGLHMFALVKSSKQTWQRKIHENPMASMASYGFIVDIQSPHCVMIGQHYWR